MNETSPDIDRVLGMSSVFVHGHVCVNPGCVHMSMCEPYIECVCVCVSLCIMTACVYVSECSCTMQFTIYRIYWRIPDERFTSYA